MTKSYLSHFSALAKNHKFLYIFIAFYCIFLVAFSRYTPNLDDLDWFYEIYTNGIEYYLHTGGDPRNMRFYPFANLEVLLLAQFSKSPYLFFAFNATLFVIFCTIYVKMLDLSNGRFALNSVIIALLALSNGFVTVFFGVCFPEKVQIVWISIFMICSFYVIKNAQDLGDLHKDSHKSSRFATLIGILSLNIALYYKEPTFIAAFAFGAILLIYALQNRQKILRQYAIYIGLCATIYALLYIVLVLMFSTIYLYPRYGSNKITEVANLLDCIANNSIIIFTLVPIAILRIYLIFTKKAQIVPFFDSLLGASLAYFATYIIALKMSTSYYFTPCFVLGIPPLLYFTHKYWRNLFIKICVILGIFGFAFQNLPTGIYKAIDIKAQGVQFKRTLDFVVQYLHQNKNIEISFIGIQRQFYTDFTHISFDTLVYRAYLIKFAQLTYDDTLRIDYTDMSKSGNLIIVSNKNAFANSLNIAQENGELIFKSGYPTIPYIALLPIVKYLGANLWGGVGQQDNFFRLPYETYIFKVR